MRLRSVISPAETHVLCIEKPSEVVLAAVQAKNRAAAASGSEYAATNDDDDPVPPADPEQRRAYMTFGELHLLWASVAS